MVQAEVGSNRLLVGWRGKVERCAIPCCVTIRVRRSTLTWACCYRDERASIAMHGQASELRRVRLIICQRLSPCVRIVALDLRGFGSPHETCARRQYLRYLDRRHIQHVFWLRSSELTATSRACLRIRNSSRGYRKGSTDLGGSARPILVSVQPLSASPCSPANLQIAVSYSLAFLELPSVDVLYTIDGTIGLISHHYAWMDNLQRQSDRGLDAVVPICANFQSVRTADCEPVPRVYGTTSPLLA
jgi:hypothetical protein